MANHYQQDIGGWNTVGGQDTGILPSQPLQTPSAPVPITGVVHCEFDVGSRMIQRPAETLGVTVSRISRIKHEHGQRSKHQDRLPVTLVRDEAGHPRFKCPHCPRTFASIENARRHEITHSENGKRYECEVCGKKFTQSYNMILHIRRAHPGAPQGETATPGSRQRCAQMEYAGEPPPEPVRNIDGVFTCSHCPKTFTTKQRAKFHSFSHSDNPARPAQFKCEICGKRFTRPHQAVLHRQALHQGTDAEGRHYLDPNRFPFQCVQCSARFTLQRFLEKHVRKMHEVAEGPGFSCQICPVTFHKTKRTLFQEHMQYHTNWIQSMESGTQRPRYRITSQIQNAFTQLASRHRIKYIKIFDPTIDLPQCAVCGQPFTSEWRRERHVIDDHKGSNAPNLGGLKEIRRYDYKNPIDHRHQSRSCAICGEKCPSRLEYLQHLRGKHWRECSVKVNVRRLEKVKPIDGPEIGAALCPSCGGWFKGQEFRLHLALTPQTCGAGQDYSCQIQAVKEDPNWSENPSSSFLEKADHEEDHDGFGFMGVHFADNLDNDGVQKEEQKIVMESGLPDWNSSSSHNTSTLDLRGEDSYPHALQGVSLDLDCIDTKVEPVGEVEVQMKEEVLEDPDETQFRTGFSEFGNESTMESSSEVTLGFNFLQKCKLCNIPPMPKPQLTQHIRDRHLQPASVSLDRMQFKYFPQFYFLSILRTSAAEKDSTRTPRWMCGKCGRAFPVQADWFKHRAVCPRLYDFIHRKLLPRYEPVLRTLGTIPPDQNVVNYPGGWTDRWDLHLIPLPSKLAHPSTYPEIKMVNGAAYCRICGHRFHWTTSVKLHIRRHRRKVEAEAERKQAAEAGVPEGVPIKNGADIWTDLGDGRIQCKICQEVFGPYSGRKETKRKLNYARTWHFRRVHSFRKEFACKICGRELSTITSFKHHERTHTGEKPYLCELCPAAFRGASCLIAHKQQYHRNKEYKCKYCGKVSLFLAHQEHMRKHRFGVIDDQGLPTGTRAPGFAAVACDKCGKVVKGRNALSRHLITEHQTVDGVKPKFFQCKLCDKGFSLIGTMRKHLRTAHEGEIWPRELLTQNDVTLPPGVTGDHLASSSTTTTTTTNYSLESYFIRNKWSARSVLLTTTSNS